MVFLSINVLRQLRSNSETVYVTTGTMKYFFQFNFKIIKTSPEGLLEQIKEKRKRKEKVHISNS